MSSIRVKTTFKTEGAYGSEETHTLYAHLHLGSDTTTFYDEDGKWIFSFEDTRTNNLFDAMNRLAFPNEKDGSLVKDIEYMTPEDSKKCGI